MTASMRVDGQQIARRAYELWRAEGEPRGRDMDYWLRAERELTGEMPRSERAGAVRGPWRSSGRVSAGSRSNNSEWAPW